MGRDKNKDRVDGEQNEERIERRNLHCKIKVPYLMYLRSMVLEAENFVACSVAVIHSVKSF